MARGDPSEKLAELAEAICGKRTRIKLAANTCELHQFELWSRRKYQFAPTTKTLLAVKPVGRELAPIGRSQITPDNDSRDVIMLNNSVGYYRDLRGRKRETIHVSHTRFAFITTTTTTRLKKRILARVHNDISFIHRPPAMPDVTLRGRCAGKPSVQFLATFVRGELYVHARVNTHFHWPL